MLKTHFSKVLCSFVPFLLPVGCSLNFALKSAVRCLGGKWEQILVTPLPMIFSFAHLHLNNSFDLGFGAVGLSYKAHVYSSAFQTTSNGAKSVALLFC